MNAECDVCENESHYLFRRLDGGKRLMFRCVACGLACLFSGNYGRLWKVVPKEDREAEFVKEVMES